MASSRVAHIGGGPITLAKDVGLGVVRNDHGRLLIFFSSPQSGITATVGTRLHRDSDLHFLAQIGDKVQIRNGREVIATATLEKLINEGRGVEIATC